MVKFAMTGARGRCLNNCGECDPLFIGDSCEQCADERFTGPSCEQCADERFTGPLCERCFEGFAGIDCTLEMRFISIPGGSFEMGSNIQTAPSLSIQ